MNEAVAKVRERVPRHRDTLHEGLAGALVTLRSRRAVIMEQALGGMARLDFRHLDA